MNAGYSSGYGDVVPFASWWERLTSDDEYDPSLVIVAIGNGAPVGFCHGWSEPFIKDVVVAVPWRRRGLAGAMLTSLLLEYRQRGAGHVDLKVDIDNLPAQAVYRSLGFDIVEQGG